MEAISVDEGVPTVLSCPRCGFDYLHQGRITAWQRRQEDAHGVEVVIDGTQVADCAKAAAAMPGRRDTLSIAFVCEGCGDGLTLWMQQHKGQTHVWWNVESTTEGT